MRKSVFVLVSLLTALGLLLTACAAPAAPAPTAQVIEKKVEVTKQVEVTKVVEKSVVVTATPLPNPEKVIDGVEANAEITFWTFWLSPTFDKYIKDTIARFNQAYPGVKVNWEDHQATFRQDLDNAFAAGKAPDVINLSVGEGWVANYATRGLLLNLDDNVPQKLKDLYFPGLWKEQLVGGKNFQFPWYNFVGVELVNMQIYSKTADLKLEDFPKKWEELPALCKTIKEKTGTLCDFRMNPNDLLSEMVYEGNVKVMSDDGKTFTFDSPEGVAWLQTYVDWVKAGALDKTVLLSDVDRPALDLFTTGKAAFFQTGPNLIRVVRENNPALYGYLAVVLQPVGKSGVVNKGGMGISVKKDTKFPKASIALAQFFTNPKSMLEFAKIVPIYPSTPSSYDDPFFTTPSVAIEDSVKPLAKGAVAQLADIVPVIPKQQDVNAIVLQAVQQAMFNNVPAQKALSDAVAKCNDLIK